MNIGRTGLCILLSTVFAYAAPAQDLRPGLARVTSQSLDAFAASQPILIEAEADSDINDRLAKLIREEMHTRRARPAAGAAALTLRFATSMLEFDSSPQQRNLGLEGQGGNRGRSTVTGVLKLPLGRKNKEPGTAADAPRLSLRFDLLSPDRKALWTGEISAARGNADRYAVFSSLVPILLDRIGKSTPAEFVPFE